MVDFERVTLARVEVERAYSLAVADDGQDLRALRQAALDLLGAVYDLPDGTEVSVRPAAAQNSRSSAEPPRGARPLPDA